MESGTVVRALFQFRPSVSEELPLFPGDVIEVLGVVDDFWLLGCKGGVAGQFPSTFVEAITIPSTKQGEKLYVCINDFSALDVGNLPIKTGDVVVVEDYVDSNWLKGRSSWGSKGIFPLSCVKELHLSSRSRKMSKRSVSEVPSYALGQARALLGLSAQLEEELDFIEGDIITIIGIPEPGWFEGELEGRRGIFPEGFVELLGPLQVAEDRASQDDHDYYGESDATAEISLGPEEGAGVYGVALYQFKSMEPEELDFDVGERIQILGTLEDGWLEGKVNGRRGIFPHRFVKIEDQDIEQEHEEPSSRNNGDYEMYYNNNDVCHWRGQEEYAHLRDVDFFNGQPAHDTSTVMAKPKPVSSSTELGHEFCRNQTQSSSKTSGIDNGALGTKYSREETATHSYKENSRTSLISLVSSKPVLPPRPSLHSLSNRLYCSVSDVSTGHTADNTDTEIPPAPATRTLSLVAKNGSRDSKAQIQSLHCSWSKDCERTSDRKNTVFQDLASLVEDPKQKKKPRFASVGDYDLLPGRGSHDPTAGSRKTESNSLPRSITLDSFASSGTDLDSKLSEQLAQFEKSLPGAIFGEHKKISRHFSILDYSSENDIMRGSPNSLDQQEATSSLETRKALRPPPPRPRILKSAAAQAAAADSEDEPRAPAESGSSQSSFSFKPSRPAPLPPQLTPRRNAGSPKPDVYQNTCSDDGDVFAEEEELQNQSECGLMETEQDHYSLLLRLQEVERDIEIYTKTTDELRLMLDEQDDEAIKAQTLENLGFCTSNIETLTMELQQLRGTDLDSKLSEQLAQFEKSLPGAIFGEHKKISRHFSILDYSSENDIMRGSPNSLDQQEATSLERRKALRPPPPRPRFLKSAAAQAAAADSEDEPRAPAESGSSQSSFSFKPSRPAPLPPQLTPRRDAGSPKPPQQTDVYQNTCSDDRDVFAEEEELQNQSECGLMETEQDHYSLLLRLQEVERDIEIYTKTTDELRLMLDEQDDEAIKAQTLENLGFCTSNIETLTMELQQLRGVSTPPLTNISSIPVRIKLPDHIWPAWDPSFNTDTDQFEKKQTKLSDCPQKARLYQLGSISTYLYDSGETKARPGSTKWVA
ncbi:UNVERIFIED_CONTAM: hypothetical protein FKN15_050010 [Acipenser sinensis]